MKQIVSTVTIMLTAVLQLAAQAAMPDDGQPVTIDYQNLKPVYKSRVGHKMAKKIQIVNINRRVFDVEEGMEEKNFNVKVPEAISGIKLPSFFALGGLPDLPGEGLPKKSIEYAENEKYLGEESKPGEAFKNYFETIRQNAKRLNEASLLYVEIYQLSIDCSTGIDQLRTSVNTKVGNYLYPYNGGGAFTSVELISRMRDSLVSMRSRSEALLQRLKIRIPEYMEQQQHYYEEQKRIELKSLSDEVESLTKPGLTRQRRAEIETVIKIQKQKISKIEEDYKKVSAVINGLEEDIKEAEEVVKQMYEYEKSGNVHTMINLLKLIVSDNYFRYTALLPKAKKDQTIFTFTVKPKELNTCTTIDKQVIKVEIETIGGFKVDFSTGAFLNIGNEDFLGREFYYVNLSDSTRKIVSAERGNRLMLSLGALMHMYRRGPAIIKLAGSVGASVTADLTSFNFHAGPSLLFGKEDRLVLTAGLTLRTAKQLDRQLQTDAAYAKSQTPDDVPRVDVFPKSGGFIALTYNLSSLFRE